MKKFLTLSLISSSFILGGGNALADWSQWGTKETTIGSNGSPAYTKTIQIYKIDNSENNTATLFGEKVFTNIGAGGSYGSVSFERFEENSGLIIYKRTNPEEEHSFSLSTGEWVNEGASWNSNYNN